jgi:hypothetical protein
VPLLKPTLRLSMKNLKGTGNLFLGQCLIEIEVSKSRETWFNQADVDELVDAGLNTVRVPVCALPRYGISCNG